MPSEALIARVEQIFSDISELGGQAERTSIITGLEVVDISITDQPNLILVKDSRDGDYIYAVKVPGILYAVSDLVNVLFIEGTEPVAMQQSAGSSGSPLAVSKLVSPDLTIDPVLSADNSGDVTLASTGELHLVAGSLGVRTITPQSALDVAGNVTVGDGLGTASMNFDAAIGSNNTLRFRKGGDNRWMFRADNAAEGGGNTGSNFSILRRTDAGGGLGTPFFIERSTGYFGVNNVAPAAQMDVDQSDTAGAIPVIRLDQADVDEPFAKYIGTAAAATLTRSIVAEADVTTATRQGFIKIEIEDIGNQVTDQDYFVPFYTLA